MSIARARILLSQRRYDAAETELRRALTVDPEDGEGYALLGVCLAETRKRPEALRVLGEAIRLMPEASFPHYVLGHVRLDAGETTGAREAAREAMRLDPTGADPVGLMAQIEVGDGKWAETLAWAERGLALDPEHRMCANLRGVALTKLRRGDEAAAAIDEMLRMNPEDPGAHANRGWQCLHANDPKAALGHFKEALRLAPGHEWARAGLVEALKARNPVYRLLLGYVLWMGSLSPAVRNGLILGGYVAFRLADQAAISYPAAGPVLRPLVWLYIAFVLLTWVGVPLFNLLLRTSRYGRHALNAEQKRGSNVFAAMVVAALTAGAAWWGTGVEGYAVSAGVVGLMTLPVSAWMMMVGTTRFRLVGWAVGVVGALGLGAAVFSFAGRSVGTGANPLFSVWLVGFLGLQLWLVFGGRGRVVR